MNQSKPMNADSSLAVETEHHRDLVARFITEHILRTQGDLSAKQADPKCAEPMTIHFSEISAMDPSAASYTEHETYRREIGRMIAAGHEGKHVLIKGGGILGIYETRDDAIDAAYTRFGLGGGCGFYIHHIQIRERVYRMSRRFLAAILFLACLR